MSIRTPEHWYIGMDTGWEVGYSKTHFNSLMSELIGAGVVGADSEEAAYFGGNKRDFDVIGDGRKCDVKNAWWWTGTEIIGFPGPGRRGVFDPANVDDIVLVLCPDQPDVTINYQADGTVSMTAVATPERVWRVPVGDINRFMKQDGSSVARWLLQAVDLEPYIVRAR